MRSLASSEHSSDELSASDGLRRLRCTPLELHNLIPIVYLLTMRGLLHVVDSGSPLSARIDFTLFVLVAVSVIAALPGEVWERRLGLGSTFWRRLPGHLYRVCFVGIIAQSYLMLRDLLPALNPNSLDAELLAIDHAILGGTPSLWLDRFNTRPIIEWFSAFYFSYFFLCATFIFSVLWLVKDEMTKRVFAIGGASAFFLGQLIYVAVPGFGPTKYLAHEFAAPLDGGFFWGLVDLTVQQGGAMKDIFPSLHTALPTYMTLFAFYAASRDRRWRIPALGSAFFTFNIIISTMLLRWHYAIDVVAGLALAFGATAFAIWVAPREMRLQRKYGLTTHWAWLDEPAPAPEHDELPSTTAS